MSHMSDQHPDTDEKLVKTAKLHILLRIVMVGRKHLQVEHGHSGNIYIQNNCLNDQLGKTATYTPDLVCVNISWIVFALII